MLRLLLLVTMWSVVMSSEWYWPESQRVLEHAPESQRVLEHAFGEENKPILWMTTDNIDNIPRYMFENWRNYTKGYDVRIYDDEQVDTYMRKHCGGLFELYTELGNFRGPFKYDIWRSCALFTEGGFYMDIKTVLRQPLKSFVRPGAITMTRGHLYPIQGIHIGFMGGPPKKSIFGKFLVEAREHGPTLPHYHYYGTLMSGLAKRYTEVVYLDETTKSYPGCVPDRYGLCGRIYDDQERLVAYTRDPKYPWLTDAGGGGAVDDVNGEYFALSHRKMNQVDALRKDKAKMKSIPHKMHFIWMQKNLLVEPLTSQTERDNAENVRAIADMNPEYETNFYDDAACQRECRQTGIEGVPELYEAMRGAPQPLWFGPSSWANMADVCRLAILYNHGGIYMDSDMAMRLPFKAWLREDVSFVAPMSVCKHKRDIFNSLLGASPGHNAIRLALERMVRDWDGHTFRALATHYTEEEKSTKWCPLYMGTIYSFLGWNATNREHTQLLDERIHWQGTFPGVQSRLHKNGHHSIGCSTIVVDPSTDQVPFYSHSLKRGNCVVVNENTLNMFDS